MKLFSRFLAGVLSAVMAAGMLPSAALAEETTLYTFFRDEKAASGVWASGNYVDEQGRGSYISEMDDKTAAREGSGSYRIKLNTPYGTNADLENLTMLHANIVGNPKAYTPQAGDYLTLWYQPLLKREKIEVGIASENSGKYTMLRVNLLDYIQIKDSEYADSIDTEWKQVKIPMMDFLDPQKAVFYDNGTGAEEFNWSRLAGFSIAGSDENLTEQVNFCRVDEVKIIQENSGEGPSDPEDQEYPRGEILYSYYEDGFISGKTWVNAIGNEYISQVEDSNPVKEGSKSWRIKLSVPEDYESNGSMLYANIVTPPGAYTPSQDDYLAFWYQPLLKRDKLEAGLACDGGDGKYAMLRVDLSKYITMDPSDYNNTSVWKLVKIPVSDLMGDSAVFYANGTGLTEFNWDRMTGFSFAASDEGLTTAQQHLCRLDTVKIVKDGNGGGEPEDPSDMEYPQGETLYSYYENEFNSGKTWVNAIGNEYISQVEDAAPAYPVKEGNKSWRIKLSAPADYISDGSMLYVNIVTPPGAYTPSQDDYLAFWYQPLLKRDKLEAGLACDGGDGKYAMLRVDLSKYMTIDASDYNNTSVWKLVKIPVSDLMGDSAVFYANGTGLTEFNWDRMTGFSFAASDEGLTTSQQHLCRLDEIKIVRSGNGGEPEEPVDPEYPKGEVKHIFFDDKCNGWGSATPTFVSMITTPDTTDKKKGTASQRIKIGGTGYVNTGDMLYASIVNNSIPAEVKTAVQEPGYLAFWYQPLLKREQIEVGFASGQVGGGQNSYAMLRVNLLDYVTIKESEWGTNVWKLVKIPLEDFQDPDKVVFDANGTNFEVFDWSQLVGFSIAVSDEGALTGQPNLCRLDEIKIVGEDPDVPTTKPEITLTKAGFYDERGSQITSLPGTGGVSAKLTFENASKIPVSGVSILLAVYDGQGALTKLTLKKITIPAGTANLQTEIVDISGADSVVKVIGLVSLKGIQPIGTADGVGLSITRCV